MAELIVTTAEDVVNGDDGILSLREAISVAASGDTILFAPELTGATINLVLGELSLEGDLTIDGEIDGTAGADIVLNPNGLSRALNALSGEIFLNALVVTNGTEHQGGGVLVGQDASVTIQNSVLSNNSSETQGGAIYSEGELTVLDSTVTGNQSESLGGGILARGVTLIEDTEISNNSGSNGGGVYADVFLDDRDLHTLTIVNSTFSENYASGDGGAIRIENGFISLQNSLISGNSSGQSGGVTLGSSYNGLISDTIFEGNSATGNFGALYTSLTPGNVIVERSVFESNSAGRVGGAVGTLGAIFRSNAFIENSAGTNGGGIFTEGGLVLQNSTLVGNSAEAGGGVYAKIDSSIHSSTFSGNTATFEGGGLYTLAGARTTLTNSVLLGNGAPNGPELFGPVDDDGSNITTGNPNQVFLQVDGNGAGIIGENGGKVPTVSLLADPANVALDHWLGEPGVVTDAAGNPRIVEIDGVDNGGVVDAGSFELQMTRFLTGTEGQDEIEGDETNEGLFGYQGNDRLLGNGGDDLLNGGDGTDTLNAGNGDDTVLGGDSETDLRDVIYAGAGNDSIDASFGNDLVYGMEGNDTIQGGGGAEELHGQEGEDVLTGSSYSDLLFGGAGDDYVNGGYGSDRINGGSGADRFYHGGVEGHGTDWVQDYIAAEGDLLILNIASATADQLQVDFAHTESSDGVPSGDQNVMEAFVIYKPSEQILWALVDGEGQSSINLRVAGTSEVLDLLA